VKTSFVDASKIKVLVKNPKRGASRKRFAFYRTGMTVQKYIARVVAAGDAPTLARADLRWDIARKFIAVS
jgi:hypothetical protein